MNSGETAQCIIELRDGFSLLRLISKDGTNRLSRTRVIALTDALLQLANRNSALPLILCGNMRFFSVGADLSEISALRGHDAFEFAEMGQRLMQIVTEFPALTCAVVEGWCMGGGFDLALSCQFRVAGPHAIFGHRGAALGLMTGWGGTQRLPRLIGKARALEIFLTAEKIHAAKALEYGIVDKLDADPIPVAETLFTQSSLKSRRSHF